MRGFADYMRSTDLLVAYRDVSGIDRALKGLSTRVRRDNPLHDASGELVRLFAELEGDFRAFFPDLLEEFRGDRDSLA
jgi:acyl carrier protein phosphodiesterase